MILAAPATATILKITLATIALMSARTTTLVYTLVISLSPRVVQIALQVDSETLASDQAFPQAVVPDLRIHLAPIFAHSILFTRISPRFGSSSLHPRHRLAQVIDGLAHSILAVLHHGRRRTRAYDGDNKRSYSYQIELHFSPSAMVCGLVNMIPLYHVSPEFQTGFCRA